MRAPQLVHRLRGPPGGQLDAAQQQVHRRIVRVGGGRLLGGGARAVHVVAPSASSASATRAAASSRRSCRAAPFPDRPARSRPRSRARTASSRRRSPSGPAWPRSRADPAVRRSAPALPIRAAAGRGRRRRSRACRPAPRRGAARASRCGTTRRCAARLPSAAPRSKCRRRPREHVGERTLGEGEVALRASPSSRTPLPRSGSAPGAAARAA